MSLLIPGLSSPSKKIDVYLQPLIEELKELWNFEVHTYDSLTGQFFQLHATLLWTINDFPTYGDLSGWSTKGYHAWVINRPLGYKVGYPSWDIDATLQRTTCGVKGGNMMERSLRTLEQYVWNKPRPMGSIVEAYVMNESRTICSRYLSGIETRFARDEQNDDTIPEDEVIGTMSSFSDEIDVMFLELVENLNNPTEGTAQPSLTPTPKRHVQYRLLELERYIHASREYIEVIKGDLQHFFVLDFNDQAMNRFVEHQMLSTFKEFRCDCHRHFKKHSDPKEARANPPHILNQMLVLQSQPTLKGSQPLSGDEICEDVLGRRLSYSKGLGWALKSKSRKMASASSATTSMQSMVELEL
ncbi:gamma-aminobutyrate transaminase POP2 [Cucumis melo var. makuwa]|uniref:Gamma-aminobutyrate transaminase POP2 n=1 Tax=Cucumis melo var. makuwa TaxID=1194695 RepID=A0A5D3CSM8_CUCMM|nr:gamma-aminobutyrate transaminase POP2 [Cucumis melo var. makuwa]TYK14525.1 gamma-aminobutyrate transaminase POP2 [Cucumis melo var. makuwa]